jgi:RNA polymerase sigma-70 factor (ECF subfamily)
MAETLLWNPDRYRPLLEIQAQLMGLDPRLQARFDSSDLVQETLLRAHEKGCEFQGATEAEYVTWLRQILENVAIDQVRKHRAQKRDVALGQSLQAIVAESSARLEKFLAAQQSSPSQRAMRQERRERLAAALVQLPDDQREAVIRRDLNEQSVAQVAEEMGRTVKAVAGLLLRGRQKLRELLQDLQ